MINKYLELSLPLKLIVGAILGIIAGPGLIGFLSEYATYAYALRIGIRPPLEGIPYLSATVTAGSLFLAVSAALVFILARMIVARIAGSIISLFRDVSTSANKLATFFHVLFKIKLQKTEHDEIIGKIKSIRTKNALLLSVGISLVTAIAIYFLESNFPQSKNSNPLHFAVFMFCFSFIAFLTLWREATIWWVAIGASVLFYVLSFYFILSIDHYSNFLRVVGYGGGVKVSIDYKIQDKHVNPKEYYLLIRTSESLIALEEDKITVTEIPINTISNINYEIGSQYRDYIDVASIANKSMKPTSNAPAD